MSQTVRNLDDVSIPLLTLPMADRPRERLLTHGSKLLSERELLAVVLRSGSRTQNAIEVGGELLDHFGGLVPMATAGVDELMSIGGIGIAKASAVVAACELGRRITTCPPATVITSASDIVTCVIPYLHGLTRERVVVVVCDSGNRVRRIVVMSDGAAQTSLLPVRETLQAVLRLDGCAFAVAHNHPSGLTQPSTEDLRTTARLRAAAETVGLRFLDHVIITDSHWHCIGGGTSSPINANENAV